MGNNKYKIQLKKLSKPLFTINKINMSTLYFGKIRDIDYFLVYIEQYTSVS